jgi:hypothetical protein
VKWDATGSMIILDTSVGPTTLQYSVTAATNRLEAGNSYSFILIATNFVGDAADSSTLENIVAATVPTIPLNLIRNSSVTPTILQSQFTGTSQLQMEDLQLQTIKSIGIFEQVDFKQLYWQQRHHQQDSIQLQV